MCWITGSQGCQIDLYQQSLTKQCSRVCLRETHGLHHPFLLEPVPGVCNLMKYRCLVFQSVCRIVFSYVLCCEKSTHHLIYFSVYISKWPSTWRQIMNARDLGLALVLNGSHHASYLNCNALHLMLFFESWNSGGLEAVVPFYTKTGYKIRLIFVCSDDREARPGSHSWPRLKERRFSGLTWIDFLEHEGVIFIAIEHYRQLVQRFPLRFICSLLISSAHY